MLEIPTGLNKQYEDKDWLYKKYVILEQSLRSIAGELKCSPSTIKKWLDKYEIPIRTNGESLKIWFGRGNHPVNWEGGSEVRICGFCGKEFEVERSQLNIGKGKFCSNRCSTTFRVKEGTFKHVGKGYIERMCLACNEKMFLIPSEIKRGRRFCSKRCALIYKGPTDIEIIMKGWLEEGNIDYDEQYLIKMPSTITIVDFFLPGKKICLYCDDEYWHNRPEVILRDRKQNKELLKMGYDIIRVKGSDIRNDIRSSLECLVGVI